jgi:hypothetical protein
LLFVPVAALLCFEHKASALVQVNEAGVGRAVAIVKVDTPFENVGVHQVVSYGGIRPRHFKEIAKFT